MGSDGQSLGPFSTPGASSGGEAAALATGMTPLGLGSDGSISSLAGARCGVSVPADAGAHSPCQFHRAR